LGLGSLELEEWKAWSLRSGEFGNMSLKVSTLFSFFFFFFILVLVLVGAIANFERGQLLFFSFSFVAYGSKWAPSPNFGKMSSSFFFPLHVLLLVGACGPHRQLLVEREPKLPYVFLFVPFVLLLLGASGLHWQLLTKKEPKLPFFLLFLFLMGAGGCHCQVPTKEELAPLFFRLFC
jgi:hypothetical protein